MKWLLLCVVARASMAAGLRSGLGFRFREGVSDTKMKAYGDKMSDQEIDDVAASIRAL